MADRLKIIFMGTPDFAVPALEAIIKAGHDVIAVYSQPPRPKGRGRQVQPSPVQALAEAHNIPVFNPVSFKKDSDAVAAFAAHNADIAIVAAYGLILPAAVLDAPRYGCLNIHASLLPRWRGASPIQRAVWAGDEQSGVTIMQMEQGLDTGPMIAKRAIPITPRMTSAQLHDALAVLGGEMIVDVLAGLPDDLAAVAQDNAQAVYAPMLRKEDGRVDWTQDASAIDRQIRALNPWPGVWTVDEQGRRLKILEAIPENGGDHDPSPAGCLIDRDGHVACGNGSRLRLIRIQPDNARPMDVAAAINGQYLHTGLMLG